MNGRPQGLKLPKQHFRAERKQTHLAHSIHNFTITVLAFSMQRGVFLRKVVQGHLDKDLQKVKSRPSGYLKEEHSRRVLEIARKSGWLNQLDKEENVKRYSGRRTGLL